MIMIMIIIDHDHYHLLSLIITYHLFAF